MLTSCVDHLVITAPSLGAGIEYVNDILGVSPQRGGFHVRMGTHNALLKLGASLYLEIIAVDPSAPKPDHLRWFELDRLPADASPRLATWVARTNDIKAASFASTLPLGRIEPMNRGELNWLITVPEDGSLPARGIAPTLIEWLTEPHPAEGLPEHGYALQQLEGFHPDHKTIGLMLQAIGFDGRFSVFGLPPDTEPFLRAYIKTPGGIRTLGPATLHI